MPYLLSLASCSVVLLLGMEDPNEIRKIAISISASKSLATLVLVTKEEEEVVDIFANLTRRANFDAYQMVIGESGKRIAHCVVVEGKFLHIGHICPLKAFQP